jgi:hypothetical protein
MSEVLTGLVGIVVGGVLTGAIEQWGAWRARKRDLRTATRLILTDAVQSASLLEFALENVEWWPDNLRPPTEEWQQYRQDLAAAMSPDDLDTVQNAFRYLTVLDNQRQGGKSFASSRKAIEEVRDAVHESAGVLLSYTRTRRQESGLLRRLAAEGLFENGGDASGPTDP